ncbi:MAG: RnfABCDGE type electron transport complex subunit D [Lachnospiraceae bacterium]|nr:RnfABCDGE type electron transport complex subunit D [Lachnospiraceae bacterium]
MSDLLNVSSSPHVRSTLTTKKVMLYVIIALLPACFFGIYNFGFNAALLILVTTASCVATEYVFNLITKRKQSINDLSAVVTGILLALNYPSTLPWYLAIIGGMFAIFFVKMVFGGLGQNFMNPALGARCFMVISFAGYMTNFPVIDEVATATPLAMIKAGESYDLFKMFIGTTSGTIGETSALAILIGALFLVATGIIDLTIPGIYILSFSAFILVFGGRGFDLTFLLAHILGGGLLLGAFFMATDYVTSPITTKGRIIYGIILGILTGLFRIYGQSAEGVSFAIIFSNLLVPLIDKISMPTPFGYGGKK